MDKKLYSTIDTKKIGDAVTVEIVQFDELAGSADLNTAKNLFFAKESGIKLKMVKFTLKDSHIRIEPGALYYMKGKLEIKATTGGGILKGLSRKMFSGETFFVSEIHGTGEIYLEPTFGHFLLMEINESDEAIIVDKGMFYAGTLGLNVESVLQKNVSSALFGGEGLWQTKIKGKGTAVLYSPVPASEIHKFELDNEKLSVDGNFALLRTEGVTFKAEKSTKSLLGMIASGEVLLQTFSGTGRVWIAPTQGIYEKVAYQGGISQMAMPPGSSRTRQNLHRTTRHRALTHDVDRKNPIKYSTSAVCMGIIRKAISTFN